MLRIHSFLQEIYGYLKLSLTKKTFRICVVFVTGTAVLTVITFSSRNFDENGRSRAIGYQSEEVFVEETMDEEIDAETKAKVQTTDDFIEIETRQILLRDKRKEENVISAKEKNQLSTVTLAHEETIQNNEDDTEGESMAVLQDQEEEPEVKEVLVTDGGITAKYNEFMDSVALTEEEENYLLHLVAAEAGGCDLVGQILVANVVFNRMESSVFPNTVTEVIFQKNQFSPTINGSIWSSTITDSVREAVERALAGEDFSEGATFFSARARLDSDSMSWFDNNLNWLFKHDGHEFYSLR